MTFGKMEREIKQIIELHGTGLNNSEIIYSLVNHHEYTEAQATYGVNKYSPNQPLKFPKKDFGLIIGRFQPFHFGHEHIINEVILDGKTPIVVIGWDEGMDPVRNPLHPHKVQELIETVFPGVCIFVIVNDCNDWSSWFESVGRQVREYARIEQLTLYHYNKECDRHEYFECYGREYHNEFYTKMFEDNEIKLKEIEFVERTDIHIDADATNLRDDFEAFKHLLDGRVYWKLKEWGW